MKSFTCCLILLLGLSFQSKSQNTYIKQWQVWIRYYNQAQLNKQFALHTEFDERRRLNPWRQAQFFAHIHLHYRVKPWLEFAAGMNYNSTHTTSTSFQTLSIGEWRPWQEISLFKKSGRDAQFQFRYRLDERFIHNNDKQIILDGYHFNWRHRFRILYSKPIVKFHNKQALTLKLSDELMLNSGVVARTFDQNRISTSLEIMLNKHWSIESGYLNQLQQITDQAFILRHAVRTTVYHRINLKQ